MEIIIILYQKYIKYSLLCQSCSEKYDFGTVRNGIESTMKVCIDFITMWHVTCHKPTNTEITLGVCFATLLSCHKWYHCILLVPMNPVIFYLSQKSAFMVPKYLYGAKIHFTKCSLSFWSTMCQAPCQAFQFFYIWILLIKMRVMVYNTWW